MDGYVRVYFARFGDLHLKVIRGMNGTEGRRVPRGMRVLLCERRTLVGDEEVCATYGWSGVLFADAAKVDL